MKIIIKKSMFIKLLCLICCILYITSDGNAQFLETGAGARPAGLAHAYTAVAEGVYGMYYNPAGLAKLRFPEISISYSRLFWGLTDNSNLNKGFIGYVHPLPPKYGTIGITWQNFSLMGYYSENILSLGYGRLFNRLGVGLVVKMLSKSYSATLYTENAVNLKTGEMLGGRDPVFRDGYNRISFGLDIGFIYDINKFSRVGVSIKNLNRPNMGLLEKDRLPIVIRTGYRYLNRNFMVSGDINYKNRKLSFHSGIEKRFFKDSFKLRAGILLGDGKRRTISTGASFIFNSMFEFDYSFDYPLSGIRDIFGTHRINLNILFGERPLPVIVPKKEARIEKMPVRKVDDEKIKQLEQRIKELEIIKMPYRGV